MDQRATSPSSHLRSSPSLSPHTPFNSHATAIGSDPILADTFSSDGTSNHNQSISNQSAFDINESSYLSHVQQQRFTAPSDVSSHTFLQAQSDSIGGAFPPQDNHTSDILDPNASFSSFDNQFFDPGSQNQSQDIDPALFLDSSVLDQPQGDTSTGDSAAAYNMSTVHQRSPDAPHLLQQPTNYTSAPAAQTSPALQQDFNQRNSLDPNSAAEWYNYRRHRREHSDALSDVSSSAQVSPFLGNTDNYDGLEQNSPLLNANDPILYNDMGFGSFTLNDNQAQPIHISPGHSPRISPNVAAQQPLPQFTSADNFGMLNPNGQFNAHTRQDMFTTQFQGQEPFPQVPAYDPNDLNQADNFSPPPEISIDFAPPARQPSFEPNKDPGDTLLPPGRGRSRRATSDPPYMTPGSSRGNSPNRAGHPSLHTSDSLSPRLQVRSLSRSGSPSGISKNSHIRRASVGAVPQNREDLILQFAEQSSQGPQQDYATPSGSPGSNASNAGDNSGSGATKRAKHPANFQCNLCSKRFTRAYNLRSHLRTHTDERPFVCTVCGKAFARQHDRKRHEGLHSGEKKFVCQGPLAGGQGQWGCRRRFARADALGRHFKSEAGRACIKPLLDEEARERQMDMHNQALQDQLNSGQPGMQPMMPSGQVDYTGMTLPAALLQQYPILADMWEGLHQGGGSAAGGNAVDDGDFSARSSFEASSGGESFYDDEDEGTYAMDDNWSTTAATSQAGGYNDYDH